MRRPLLYPIVLLASVAAAPREPLYGAPALEGAVLGSAVREVVSGEMVEAQNAGKLLTPASTVKLVTAMALLDALPLDLVINTPVGARGEVIEGALMGDLVILGAGDPSLTSDSLGALADAIVGTGLTRVEGDVVADARLFSHVAYGEGWMWDDLPFAFSPPVTALSVDGNTAVVTVRATTAGEPAELVGHPCVPTSNQVVTVTDDVELDLRVERLPDTPVTTIRGVLPVGVDRRYTLTIPDPSTCVAGLLTDALVERGVEVAGTVRLAAVDESDEIDVVATRVSPPLRELLAHMLVQSDNLYAESLIRLIDPAPTDRSFEGARPAIEALMARAGVPPDGWRLVDASGLSRYDLLSADTLVALLRYGWVRPWRDDLVALLPSSGQGTLGDRLTEGPASTRVFAKTGSMRGVYNVAGYVLREEGEPLAFALMSNGVAQPSAVPRAAQDVALQRLSVLPPPRGCARRR